MRTRRFLLVLAVLFCSVAARHRAIEPPVRTPIADVFTAANPNEVTSTHLALDLTVDFNTQAVRGSVTHTLLNRTGAKQLILDTEGLDIDGVTADGKKATWTLGTVVGSSLPLIINIDAKTQSVRIDYHTHGNASGLHWLKAKETRNGSLPAMWSENEPYMARSWIPLQDTPFVRVTYDATIHVPTGEMALMSVSNNPRTVNANGVYSLSQPHPIPSYLIAIAVGQYAYRAHDDRTGVYAEPNLIDDSAYETSYMPAMLSAAERVMGPYPFERYDIIFPTKYQGGMENPELNFIGQDAVTGNHPAVVAPSNLLAHELAHTWFGDLLTCAQWNDLWQNEGFANYFSGRIDQEMGATELAEYAYVQDRKALDDFLTTFNPPARTTVLHRTFVGSERPSFTVIYYQKGEIFLHALEDQMGRAAFDAFIAQYIGANRFHWVDDLSFRDVLMASTYRDLTVQSSLLIDDWLYGSGLPSNISAKPTSSLQTRVTAQADAFRAGTAAADIVHTGWSDVEEGLFLSLINDLIVPRRSELDAVFGFSQRKSPPLNYLSAAAKSLDPASRTLLDTYLGAGRPNSLSVWYVLSQSNDGRAYAVPLYNKVRDVYDSNARSIIASYLKVAPE